MREEPTRVPRKTPVIRTTACGVGMARCGSETPLGIPPVLSSEMTRKFGLSPVGTDLALLPGDGKRLPLKASPPAFELLHQAACESPPRLQAAGFF